ncbi:MAG: HEAT repeat domain-containing protein [Verrucomicrobia bacterium]|nr:HEAT repeat domain-containing protein [Verrucomicrobiota bacterium]
MVFCSLFRGAWCVVALAAGHALRAEDGPAEKSPQPHPWQVAGVRAALKDPSLQVRALVLRHCHEKHWTRVGLKAEDVLPLLRHTDVNVNLGGLMGLEMMGPEVCSAHAKELIPLLIQHRGTYANVTAMRLLRILSPEAVRVVVRGLLPSLKVTGRGGKENVLDALLECSRNAAPFAQNLLPLLNDDDLEVRIKTVKVLGQMALGETAPKLAPAFVKALLPMLQNDNDRVKLPAFNALRNVGAERAPLVARELLPLLQSRGFSTRLSAVTSMGFLGKEAASILVPALITLLEDKNNSADAVPHAKALLPLLHDPDYEVRLATVLALREIGKGTSLYLNDLLPLLQDPEMKESVVFALSSVGAEGAPAVFKALLPLLKSTDSGMMRHVASAFWGIRAYAAPRVNELLSALQAASPEMQLCMVEFLASVGQDAEPYVRLRLALLQDQDPQVRSHMLEVIGSMGPGAAVFAKELLSLSNDRDAKVRAKALLAFSNMGAAATPYAKDLLGKLDDSDGYVHTLTLFAFENMGPEAGPVLVRPLLARLMKKGTLSWNVLIKPLGAFGNFNRDPFWQCSALAKTDGLSEDDIRLMRSQLYLWSGHSAELLLSVRWLGRPAVTPMPAKGLSVAEQQAVLEMLLKLWPHSVAFPALRKEIAERLGDVAESISTVPKKKVVELLKKLESELKADAVADSKVAAAKACAAVQGALAGNVKAGK